MTKTEYLLQNCDDIENNPFESVPIPAIQLHEMLTLMLEMREMLNGGNYLHDVIEVREKFDRWNNGE